MRAAAAALPAAVSSLSPDPSDRSHCRRCCPRSYGHLTWEWGAETQLRGYAHPLLFAALYKLLELLGLSGSVAAMVYAPRLLQAACAAACDVAVHRLALRWFDARTARWCAPTPIPLPQQPRPASSAAPGSAEREGLCG